MNIKGMKKLVEEQGKYINLYDDTGLSKVVNSKQHSILLGGSGSGKSWGVYFIISQLLLLNRENIEVILFDIKDNPLLKSDTNKINNYSQHSSIEDLFEILESLENKITRRQKYLFDFNFETLEELRDYLIETMTTETFEKYTGIIEDIKDIHLIIDEVIALKSELRQENPILYKKLNDKLDYILLISRSSNIYIMQVSQSITAIHLSKVSKTNSTLFFTFRLDNGMLKALNVEGLDSSFLPRLDNGELFILENGKTDLIKRKLNIPQDSETHLKNISEYLSEYM